MTKRNYKGRSRYWGGGLFVAGLRKIVVKTGGMCIVINVKKQISAALLRRDMKRARKAHGLSTNLRAMIAEYRAVCPEYAEKLERIIYPPLMTASG